ncbi:hypothetical protein [Acinetobacter sp. MB5]|uniref:hypothetical protein n=1 Tax=Acinetobacter sp. MB5 TaxID=2069438 RepID=UPI000DD054F8|nr:hypothetical protein [Acinetobacter sp. MB5]
MQLQPNISKTIFYSFLFALGGAPTLAMLIASQQTQNQQLLMSAFIGLSVVLVCVFVPIVLIQNTFLLIKRRSIELEEKIKPLSTTYFLLNVSCLLFWILFMFKII